MVIECCCISVFHYVFQKSFEPFYYFVNKNSWSIFLYTANKLCFRIFRVAGQARKYRLRIGGYTGTAGIVSKITINFPFEKILVLCDVFGVSLNSLQIIRSIYISTVKLVLCNFFFVSFDLPQKSFLVIIIT